MLWNDIKDWFDPETNGVLPDVNVNDTSIHDWQTLIDLVPSTGWPYEYSVGGPSRSTQLEAEPPEELQETRPAVSLNGQSETTGPRLVNIIGGASRTCPQLGKLLPCPQG